MAKREAGGADTYGRLTTLRRSVWCALLFAAVCIGGVFLHELGHAVGGWLQGIAVVPTPAKEYILRAQVDWQEMTWIALGGVAATTLVVVGSIGWYLRQRNQVADVVLAGVLVPPLAYTVRFLLVGRGHDGVEWQAAQAAIGVAPSGHALDVLFACLFLAGGTAWIVRRHSSLRLLSLVKAVGLMFFGIVLLVVIQVTNNLAFDRFFPSTQTLNQPSTLDAR